MVIVMWLRRVVKYEKQKCHVSQQMLHDTPYQGGESKVDVSTIMH